MGEGGSGAAMTGQSQGRLSGTMVCRLMRRHHVTIEDLATRFNITRTRIRTVRLSGVTGFQAQEWVFMITGRWPDETKGDMPCAR